MNKLALLWSFSLVLASGLTFGQTESDIFREVDLFFQKHVVGNKVDYQLIGQDRQGLEQLSKQVSATKWEKMEGNTQKAFLINAYNVFTVAQIMEHYPISTSQEVPGFFQQTKFQLGAKKYTLDQIENKLLRPVFKDARLHFVLVCGANGCPPIIERAYRPESLDRQLERQTRRALNDPGFVRLNAEKQQVGLSQIFEWYKGDFTKDGQSLTDFVNRYRTTPIPEGYKVVHYPYDWSLNSYSGTTPFPAAGGTGTSLVERPTGSNVQTFTPSVLLRKDQVEVKLFNNLYTQTHWYNNTDGERSALNQRQTFYTGIFQFLYGASDQARINVGFDVNLKGVRYDGDPDSSPLLVFGGDSDTSRMTITSFGPKIKFSPIKKLDHFSIQSAFWIPVGSNLEGSPWIDRDRYTWWNQFFFDHSFNDHFQVFTEADLLFWFSKDRSRGHQLQTPLSLFLSYFPTSKATIYGMVQYSPTYEELASNQEAIDVGAIPRFTHGLGAEWMYNNHFAQTGVGAKYQVLQNLEVEALYTNFFAGFGAGAGSTFNIGLRFLR